MKDRHDTATVDLTLIDERTGERFISRETLTADRIKGYVDIEYSPLHTYPGKTPATVDTEELDFLMGLLLRGATTLGDLLENPTVPWETEADRADQEAFLVRYMKGHGYELVRTNNSIFFRLKVEAVTPYMRAHRIISLNSAVKKYNTDCFTTGKVTTSLKIQQSGNRIVLLNKILEVI